MKRSLTTIFVAVLVVGLTVSAGFAGSVVADHAGDDADLIFHENITASDDTQSVWVDVAGADSIATADNTTTTTVVVEGNNGSTVDELHSETLTIEEGNVSQLQGMVGLTNQTAEGDDAISVAAKQLKNEGAIGLVLGPPGAGKTAYTVDTARGWGARTGGKIIGNTSWDDFDAKVNSDREMLEEMANYDGPVLAVLDETAQDLSGFGADNKKAEQFANSLTFIRKKEGSHGPYAKRGSVLMVSHTRQRTAAPFRRLATFAMEKPSRSDPGRIRLLETEGGKDKFEESTEFKGLTDTRERYSEHEASEFRIVWPTTRTKARRSTRRTSSGPRPSPPRSAPSSPGTTRRASSTLTRPISWDTRLAGFRTAYLNGERGSIETF